MSSETPAGHPAIDWSKWEPAGEGDVRSPCPMINALANHHILPHSGKKITKAMAVEALTSSLNLDSGIANVFASVAVTANPDHSAHSFDLDQVDKHGLIEHDVSLSRNDIAFGDNHSFNSELWEEVMKTYGDATETSFASVSKARYGRVAASKQAHADAKKDFQYGIKEFILSYGESALFLGILGSPKDGKIPLEYLRVLFQEERVPYKEGWRRLDKPLTQMDMNHIIFALIKENEHKAAEASDVGLGTVHAVSNAVTSILPSFCSIM
ncbi:Cloroperoxidase [Mollisia scopiformis]|uniref:Cloroperoxidase n=1 Tax=Mollisia scopiformis TaxID=149040 RepID=A0A132B1Z8_MOLSC|nr:Cloroperoxidase [Mollisia scopiformis]KUJ06331.1 Cloroperoxidase [Mollisia scopiformis]